MRKGFNYKFKIPTYDVDGDFVRCRFALAANNECGGVCTIPPPAKINETTCELSFDANTASNGYYALSMMLEDFATSTSTSPMSSVPIQLLIQVVSVTSTCVTPPKVIGDRPADSCIGVPIGTTITERAVGQVSCTSVTMDSLQLIGSSGMLFSQTASVTGTTDQYYVNINWTPTAAQYGPNMICARAIDSTYLSSDLYCFTLLAGIEAPSVVVGSGSPSGALSAAVLAGTNGNGRITWTAKFNMNITRPTKSRYIIFYRAFDDVEELRIDVSTSTDITYSDDTITFETGNTFSGSYYIEISYGVGVLPIYCNPESASTASKTFWTFSAPITATTTQATTTLTTTTNILTTTNTISTTTLVTKERLTECTREGFITLMGGMLGFFSILHVFSVVAAGLFSIKNL